MRKLSVVLVALALCPALSAEERPTRPLLSLHGDSSKILKGGYFRIESADAWDKLWKRHTLGERDTKSPVGFADVDFERCMVVAVFEGKKVNNAGYEVHSIAETDDAITLRVLANTYSTGLGGESKPTSAFGIFLLPRSKKTLRIELGEGAKNQDERKWTKVAEFKAGDGSLEK